MELDGAEQSLLALKSRAATLDRKGEEGQPGHAVGVMHRPGILRQTQERPPHNQTKVVGAEQLITAHGTRELFCIHYMIS